MSAWVPGCRAVLQDVFRERAAQVARYGLNEDLEDGTGRSTAWLAPVSFESAENIEALFRRFYEDYEEEHGKPTWSLLVREELAEAFAESDPDRLREELVQVAALAVSWIEKIDSRNTPPREQD